jgi:hypothetical protein
LVTCIPRGNIDLDQLETAATATLALYRLSDACTGAPVANQTDGTRRAYLENVG